MNNLNSLIQDEYNAEGMVAVEPFRIGDKVRHTVNNYELDVFNGDTGYINGFDLDSPDEDTFTVKYPGKPCPISYNKELAADLILSYASTVHASQGSEYAVVYVLMDHEVSTGLLIRKLAYTAVTRAKLKCYILSIDNSINVAINNNYFKPRLTKLSEFISRESGERDNEYCFD